MSKHIDKLITLTCAGCNKPFETSKKLYKSDSKRRKQINFYCSNSCKGKSTKVRLSCTCAECFTAFDKTPSQIKKSKNHFCSQTCSAKYNNRKKITGHTRSKLEIWLESKLPLMYPALAFKFNSKEEINSELDIYLPSLKLAFEINGIVHYKPIYGLNKFDSIQLNDMKKLSACSAAGILLHEINASSQKKFTEESSQEFLQQIEEVINKKLSLLSDSPIIAHL